MDGINNGFNLRYVILDKFFCYVILLSRGMTSIILVGNGIAPLKQVSNDFCAVFLGGFFFGAGKGLFHYFGMDTPSNAKHWAGRKCRSLL